MQYLSAVDYCFKDVPGGMGRVAWDDAVLMRDRGYKVTMFCKAPRGYPLQSLPDEYDGIQLGRYQAPELPGWHRSTSFPRH